MPRNFKDEAGKRYGKLLVIERIMPNTKTNNALWLCECDCGVRKIFTGAALRNTAKSCGCSQYSRMKVSETHPSWRGGRYVSKGGYVWISDKSNANSNTRGYVMEHIAVMAKRLGRKIDTKTESVHHKNGDKQDNRLENLELRSCYHGKGQSVDECVNYAIETLKRYRPELLVDITLAV